MHSPDERAALLRLARESIAHGLAHGEPLAPDLAALPPALREPGAAFVTLHLRGALRGCIGTIEAWRPLAEDVAGNAFAAAFEDPRFEPVTTGEADALDLHVSVLTRPQPLPIEDEADLLRKLRPGIDGLILGDGRRRATFLPSVWDELPDPAQFVRHLKRKAGLREDAWSDTMRAWTYQAEGIGDGRNG